MALPYPTKVVLPFDIATAQDMNERHANDVALANGSGLEDGAVTADKLGDTGWITPTFGSNYDGGSTVQYRKIGDVVYLRGQAIRDSGTPTSTDEIFTLPVGYRPANTEGTPQIASGSAANYGKIHVQQNGLVTVATTATGGSYLLLSNFNFLTT